LTNVTFEAWVTWNGGAAWQNIFVFGSTDSTGLGEYGLFGTPTHNGTGRFRMGFGNSDPGFNNEFDVDSPNLFPTNASTHLVVAYAPADGGTRIYINGNFNASGGAPFPMSDLQDALNYLGRSGYNPDPPYKGSFDEFRIYSGALSGIEVANNFILGPNGPSGIPLAPLTAHLSNGQLVLTWPTNVTGSTLSTSMTLGSGASWVPANATVIQTNDVFSATISPTNSASFYRLQK
jgi:hypothetical protein